MELRDAIMQRRSIRAFKKEPVDEKIVEEILNVARWAPSWGNTQPWNIYVLVGDALERFRRRNREAFLSGKEQIPDIEMPEDFPPDLKERYMDLGRSVLNSLHIKREDYEARRKYWADMFSFFDAPVLLIFTIKDMKVISYPMLDVGIIIGYICLLAHEKGLGTCVLANSCRFPKLLREIAHIPEDEKIVMGIGMGYPIEDSPINNFERNRTPLGQLVRWIRE